MTDDLLKQLSSLSETERTQLLEFYKTLPDSEEALDELTQTPNRSGKRLWTDSEPLVFALEALLQSVMGKDSPYQFAGSTLLYRAYVQLHEIHAPFHDRMGAQKFKIFMRKWIIKNNLAWTERSFFFQAEDGIRYPNGYIATTLAGWGKKKLTNVVDGKQVYTFNLIPLETVWQSQAYY